MARDLLSHSLFTRLILSGRLIAPPRTYTVGDNRRNRGFLSREDLYRLRYSLS